MTSLKLLAFLSVCLFETSEAKYADKLLLVSMDGFRWDYLYKAYTPNFDKFIQNGIKVDFVNNSFVTKTFPNHYTIVTGKGLTNLFSRAKNVVYLISPRVNINFN